MQPLLSHCRRSIWLALALTAAALVNARLHAEEPVNPLREIVLPDFMHPLGDDLAAQLQQTAEHGFTAAVEAPAQPLSAVPEQFGQSDLLPAVALGVDMPAVAMPGNLHGKVDGSQPLVHPWFVEPWFSHSDPNDPDRHIGLGQPLIGTSWRNRPLFAGTFIGGVLLDDLIRDRVDQSDTTFLGMRLGHDFDHYWCLELRYAYARPELADEAGSPLGDHARDYFVDLALVHYPWGDAHWRPYVLAGLGFQTFRFNDDRDRRISESLLSIPIGVGLKYFSGPWFTLRFDFVDNIALGNERVSGMNNIAFLMGAEFRFGGRRQSYFPWHTNTTYW